jgi:hypothetical protein
MIIIPYRNTNAFTKAGNEERTLRIKIVTRTLFLELGTHADIIAMRTNNKPSAYSSITHFPAASER